MDEYGNPIAGQEGNVDPNAGGEMGGFDPSQIDPAVLEQALSQAQGMPSDGQGGGQIDPNTGQPLQAAQGAGAENPWEWAEQAGVDPNTVKDTFENYTKKTQQTAAERKALDERAQQLSEVEALRDEIMSNPALQQYLQNFYDQGMEGDPNLTVQHLQDEVEGLKFQKQMESDLSKLSAYVKENNLPSFDNDKVIKFMVENQLPNPQLAYKAMTYEDFGKKSKEDFANELKNQTARIPGAQIKGANQGSTIKGRPTAEDISKMSDEDFNKNYPDLLKTFGQ